MSINFKAIYKILKILESSMDCEMLDIERLRPDVLGITEQRKNAILVMLVNEGFINGLQVHQSIGDTISTISDLSKVKITLKGIEYLEENSLMKKVANIAKGIVDITM